MPVEWNEDDPRDLPVIQKNLNRVLRQILHEASSRQTPTVALAQGWHREVYRDVRLPVPYFAGEIRDSDSRFPELFGYEVIIGNHYGAPSRDVPEELSNFEAAMRQAVRRLDSVIPVGARPDSTDLLRSVLTLCAYSHGEWIRIHPFANGNGRTARIWADWCAVRYGLPAFVRLTPRPEGLGYALAAARSMRGDHNPMIVEMNAMLNQGLWQS
ncbi:MAG TPA: Fic family protein [Thermoanaerobaculia bacterium]